MNSRELQLGDFVYYHGIVHRVTYISDFDGVACVVCVNDESSAFTKNVEPIPLTAEILEKNGWAKEGIFMFFIEDPNTKLAWTDRCGACLYKNGYLICDCGHVHTLQHALRLLQIEKEIKL